MESSELSPVHTREEFLLVAGNGRLSTHAVTKSELIIGRDPACDIVIEHKTFSRRHALVRLGSPITVEDLGSTNGISIGGERITTGPHALRAGEGFQIGPYSFMWLAAAAEPSSAQRSGIDRLRVEDPTIGGIPAFVRDVATSASSVLILGESGVGKDVLAETIHKLSGRGGDMARINCAALAENLIESELFGHEKGAFTGATTSKEGLLESAQSGTVFLDEIGELPLATQAKLLRAIESREVRRIGAVRSTTIDVRFIAATNRDLPTEVAAKRFRHDLYFRLDGITLLIPPLRERTARLPMLAMRFLEQASNARGRGTMQLEPDVFAALQAYDWPGNVRELKAVIERALLLARGNQIGVRHLAFSPRVNSGLAPVDRDAGPTLGAPAPVVSAPSPVTPDEIAANSFLALLTADQRTERQQIVDALAQCAGNQTKAAKLLGLSRTTLVQRILTYRISRPRDDQ